MRVHDLRITAFGPFTDTVRVDGDALAADGLFLLSGPTGAGKSSVLDAICFALYGAVPGRRNEAKAPRSDRAAADVATEVVLEVSLGERRYRFTRSPAWERPKKRGDGTTTQQATVSVQQLVDGAWRHETNRLDEAGDLVGRLLGMTCSQFCQVAMLPQGEFSTFLQARSDERQQVLAQLFRTDRYDRVATWLVEHRRATRRLEEAARRETADVLSRLCEATGTSVPDGGRATPDTTWLGGLRREVTDAATAAEADGTTARAAAASARDALERDRATARAQEAWASAERRRAALADAEPALARDADRLDAARRAAPIALLDQQVAAAEAAVSAAEHRWDAAAASAGVGGPDDVEPALQHVRRRLGRLQDARPVEAELQDAREAATRLGRELVTARTALARADEALTALPGRVATLGAEHARLTAQAAGLSGLREAEGRAVTGRRAALAAAELEQQVAEARVREVDAREEKQARHETWLAVREARLEGIAAELAGGLAVGGHCPVCGSCEHPAPAARSAGAVDQAAEKRARVALDDAEGALAVHTDQVHGLQVRLATSRTAAADHDEPWWRTELDRLRGAVALASTADVAARETASLLADAEDGLATARDHRSALAARVAAADSDEGSARTRVDATARRLEALLDDAGGAVTSLDDALAATRAEEAALERASSAARDLDAARTRARESRAAAEASAVAHHFDDLAAARAAVLDETERVRLEALAQAHREEQRALAAVLADPATRSAARLDPPDLPRARVALDEAESAAADAAGRAVVARRRQERVTELAGALEKAWGRWTPAAEDATRADAMADLVTGRSADNRLRLSLAAYVLSWRLGQVVDAANVRLAPMTDGRFVLEHDAALPTRGGRRGGLDLMVRDEWSGTSRPPTTLSGGETFVVSLALALGLADVVSQEASADAVGVDIDTLFVDEGFGSLDADTLDDVMGVLDGLRTGGRIVGVVSHVASMKERIGRRLEVTPGPQGGPHGSRVRLVDVGA
ncbi:SMC family ATPase [uncultured Nocardioides sp.]|uniref:AAA family ATPase n=1 Tax=uncultured Nocardioides sp. TaxID=198441 RepID=UPI0026250892|nr:SMC family ATPase [uncultured Nocardioides sp.]